MSLFKFLVKRKKHANDLEKSLLIVDDNNEFLEAGKVAGVSRGYQVDTAIDLNKALELLHKRQYVGVITDICFPTGTGRFDVKPLTSNDVDQNLLKDIDKHLRISTQFGNPREYNGVHVTRECKKKNIPVVAITSTGHDWGVLYYLVEQGLTTPEELGLNACPEEWSSSDIPNASNIFDGGKSRDLKTYLESRKLHPRNVALRYPRLNPEGQERTLKFLNKYFGNYTSGDLFEGLDGKTLVYAKDTLITLENNLPAILSKALLIRQEKSIGEYNDAISLLEGKTPDELRPYFLTRSK